MKIPAIPVLRARLSAVACSLALLSPVAALATDPVKIGYTGPLSGSLSLLGQGVRDGIEVYVSYINEQGGVNGRKIEFIAEDDGYEPMRTVAAAKKLAEQDKVVAGHCDRDKPFLHLLVVCWERHAGGLLAVGDEGNHVNEKPLADAALVRIDGKEGRAAVDGEAGN